VNQTLEDSTFLSGEIKGAFLSAIGNAESLVEGRTACLYDEFGFSPSQSAHLANPPPMQQLLLHARFKKKKIQPYLDDEEGRR
jgi:hypothetical protein